MFGIEYVTWAKWILRLVGLSICLAFFPIFFPLAWMQTIHGWLGLGQIPDEPIFEYLARSLSAMYFAHGCFVLMVSFNVIRYLPMVRLIAVLNMLLGAILLGVDLKSPMPSFWTLTEGPPIMLVGGLLWWIASKIDAESDHQP